MLMLNENNIESTDNRDCHSTYVIMKNGKMIEVEILTCIELIINMLENNPEVMISTKDLHECLEELKGELVGER